MDGRVVFAAPMPERFVLDPPSALIKFLVRQHHEMKRVGDLDSVRLHGLEHSAIRPGQVQRGGLDAIQPCVGSIGEPGGGASGGASLDNVEELRVVDVDNLGGPLLTTPPPESAPQGLIEPESGDLPEPIGIINQHLPVGDHGS